MANLARVELPPAASREELYTPLTGVGSELPPPANEAELQERVERAAAFLKRNPMPLVGDYDGPEVSGA